ncbi:hypothetical protein FOMPIDRAFT_93727 [Fomitopsis schrenkii]|uniref:Protein kinase domain-containing protein n=1 Tax=Fomitopsis schrenkii TaxID=2126942 RepID=S8EV32_FOMSC|nr:hypothetical protein FOMPIDRAFT_93727 [Fomitopsis schrenkii]
MSLRTSPSPSSRSSSPSAGSSTSSSRVDSGSDMQGTERTHKSATRAVLKQHTHQNSEANKDSWAAEIGGKISLVNEPLHDFFRDYVPCHSEFVGLRPWTDPAKVFEAVPSSGKETDKYPHLIKGLRQLVSEFHDVRRPKFADGSKCAVRFPFKEWEEEHHYTLPDILMSFPGEDDHDDTWAKTWHRIAMVCEVKNTADPINESAPWPSVRQSGSATGVLTQLAKSARNLMLTHGMLFVFVVGIYKDSARIYRFDRAACVVSKSFNIKTTPWPLHELLWRICHYEAPVGGLPTGTVVPRLLGEDPTLFRASEQDKDMADKKCQATGQRPLSEDEWRACRWVTVAKHDSEGKFIHSTRVLLYRVRSLNPRLFSRATVVWEGYEDVTWKRVAVKDAWRQVARDREDAFYDQIRDSMQNRSWRDILDDYKFLHRNNEEREIPPLPSGEGPYDLPPDLEELLVEAELDPVVGELFGLARMQYGDDLGAREMTKLARSKDGSYPWPAYHEFYHRTVCRGLPRDTAGKDDNPEYNDRSHMRLVFETVGRPLSQFRSTKELIRSFRDAIYGHRQAYRAGIIHRDISENNIMLSDDLMSFFIGFLLDFDYGFNWKDLLRRAGWEVSEAAWERYVEEYNRNLPYQARPAPPEVKIPPMGPTKDDMSDEAKAEQEEWRARMKIKERTGTLYFMAIEILRSHVAHDVRHDLESFFWLLLWVILRYTRTTRYLVHDLYINVFGAQTDDSSALSKEGFLFRMLDWEVKDNKPLTTLLSKFKDIVADQNFVRSKIPLTYESVLTLFDEALASPGWPTEDDHARPFKMPSTAVLSASCQDNSNVGGGSRGGSGERREVPGDVDPLTLPPHKRAHVYRRPVQNPPVADDANGGN